MTRHPSAVELLAWTASPVVAILFACDLVHAHLIRPTLQSFWETVTAGAAGLLLASAAVLALTAVEAVVVSAYAVAMRRIASPWKHLVIALVAAIAASPILMLLARQPFVGNRYRDTPVAVYGPWIVLAVLLLMV